MQRLSTEAERNVATLRCIGGPAERGEIVPEYRFPLGGSDLQGRIVGLAFFVAGLFLLALAGLLAVQTTMWLGARERIEGTVVAVEHGSHAVVEGQAIDGRWMRRASARRRSWDLRRVSR